MSLRPTRQITTIHSLQNLPQFRLPLVSSVDEPSFDEKASRAPGPLYPTPKDYRYTPFLSYNELVENFRLQTEFNSLLAPLSQVVCQSYHLDIPFCNDNCPLEIKDCGQGLSPGGRCGYGLARGRHDLPFATVTADLCYTLVEKGELIGYARNGNVHYPIVAVQGGPSPFVVLWLNDSAGPGTKGLDTPPTKEQVQKKQSQLTEMKADEFVDSLECSRMVKNFFMRGRERMAYTRSFTVPENELKRLPDQCGEKNTDVVVGIELQELD